MVGGGVGEWEELLLHHSLSPLPGPQLSSERDKDIMMIMWIRSLPIQSGNMLYMMCALWD